jgi:hypothetical protein
MQVSTAEVTAVRVEKPIELDPSGYLIVVGQEPADRAWTGIAWLFVLGVALANVVALGVGARARRAGR